MTPSSQGPRPDLYTILDLPWTGPGTATGTGGRSITKKQLKAAYHRALLRHHPDKVQVTTTATTGTSITARAGAQSSPGFGTSATTTGTHDKKNDPRLYTIDQITDAYKTLSDEKLRSEYDRSLFALGYHQRGGDSSGSASSSSAGLDVVDLDDFECVEDGIIPDRDGYGEEEGGEGERGPYWYRGCRCGDEKGYLISEDELEENAESGEIVVGCRGCSLWIRVLFGEDTTSVEKEGHDRGA